MLKKKKVKSRKVFLEKTILIVFITILRATLERRIHLDYLLVEERRYTRRQSTLIKAIVKIIIRKIQSTTLYLSIQPIVTIRVRLAKSQLKIIHYRSYISNYKRVITNASQSSIMINLISIRTLLMITIIAQARSLITPPFRRFLYFQI